MKGGEELNVTEEIKVEEGELMEIDADAPEVIGGEMES